VPLSEHEQRLLEQMERALYAEDPKFASSLRGKDPRSNFRRRVLLAGLGFVVGIVLLMTGLVAQIVLVSVLGFLLMLASAFFAVTSYRAVTAAAQLGVVDPSGVRRAPHPAAGRKARGHGGFMARVEERWNRRRDDNGR
jgi:predicted lipid-binding transport protein (Tim44 family)